MLNRNFGRLMRFCLVSGAVGIGAIAVHAQAADKMSDTPAGKAYHDAMMKMDRDMMKGMTGDPDKDFVMMMIPHHQGAIDMAKIVIQHGKDAELKKMAQEGIPKQEKEIADMKRWLDTHK